MGTVARWLCFLGFGCFFQLAAAAGAEVPVMSLAEVRALIAKTPQEGGYVLVDARPEIKFQEGHLPWAVSLPWPEVKERLAELPAQKGVRLVFYCGGVKCDLSHKAAAWAQAQGFADVAVFHEGEPAWKASGESLWVGTGFMKILLNDRERVAQVIDARPLVKYLEGTIPGALSLPWPEWDQRRGLLPADQGTPLIFFCGGVKCDLSHKAAAKARELGYRDVRVYAEGWPVWAEQSTRAFALVNPKAGGVAPALEAPAATGEIKREEFMQLLQEAPAGLLLVDVRPEEEYRKAHLPGAIQILDERIGEHAAELAKAREVVFYCNTGSRAAVAYYAAEDAQLKQTRFLNRSVEFKPDGSFEIR
jgi:rhodanese-related sulfurtransferase